MLNHSEMVWKVAYEVTRKDGKKLDAEVEVAPTEAEIEAQLPADLVYTGM